MDNPAMHKSAVFLYEAFAPEDAKRKCDRFEFINKPRHSNWLNMVEIELNLLIGQCLNR